MSRPKGRHSQEIYLDSPSGQVKVCSKCRIPKSLDEYNKDTSQKWGIRTACRECSIGLKHHRNKTRSKQNHLWSKYRMRPEEYQAKLEEQGSVCAICGIEQDRSFLCVDHDHSCCPSKSASCGECTRGLICSDCNLGLGRFNDDTELLDRAIDYLEYWRKNREG